MSKYPILVARYGPKHPADLAICERCGYERTWDPSEGDPYDLCIKHEIKLENGCHGQIHMKYVEGDTCRSCGKLDYGFPVELKGCCSRRCMLQHEYALALRSGT